MKHTPSKYALLYKEFMAIVASKNDEQYDLIKSYCFESEDVSNIDFLRKQVDIVSIELVSQCIVASANEVIETTDIVRKNIESWLTADNREKKINKINE